MFTKKNKAEEDKPWATIIRIAPFTPTDEKVKRLARINPMCATEE